MSEKLTVAELMARNGRKSADGADESSRRRRRRNLESGGVSVAELTGSIPVVTQKDVDEQKAADAAAQAPAERKPAPRVSRRAAEKPGEVTTQMTPVKDAPAAAQKPPVAAETRNAETKSTGFKRATTASSGTKPVDAKPAETKPVANKPVENKPAADKSRTPAQPVSHEDARKAEAQLIGGDNTAATTATSNTAAKPNVEKPSAFKPADEKPAANKPFAKAAAAVPASAAAATSAKGAPTPVKEKEVASNLKKDPAATRTERTPVPAKKDDEFAALEAALDEDEVIDYEDNTISWPAMIGQALLAIAAGVGIFFGFSLLWSNLPSIVVLVLALAVTLLLVGLVHALLRHNDKLLMLLAFVVGLILTFGPRLVIGI
ncbi:hypothetical protein [Corynebacterium suicordis]|uniref:Transmembrane protein n=1 Tax=Corynebacterium suicordis DSM 45110 TaxID=1121369 RepID=A0ABR9ZH86_9CORY|nr:hypothetical protein [Corynebacterium suicordis]MBF4552785.1 hypothetical protein [Corynebacterium suicordis DSM 45110]MDR6278256.1 hypothetical protein [Corynebacterium suicordis]